VIIPIGAPGSGKSTVLNTLAGKYQFKASNTAASGETKEISSY
jgi:ribosome biogenesis GTPase A